MAQSGKTEHIYSIGSLTARIAVNMHEKKSFC